ncbi:uncharacterized protein PFL1_02809 [Pseudozyma flocculosa PF-1]|uniref:Related to RAD4 - Excision repair protein n=2 Tax=Pseudozyma flocculosa TaxID=84751 RepID=A0A5C3F4J3_9BASI|nr:uncharacterized protein PFL1_02809 [Pseudozyma flocculosa PF-1]EPQ29590.1 hypothetical protein PFL1_02809 [Pseudozyma flocculosa PF-1]SPO38141.1 related to RAD4 - Excision repair protein [Pseudozyma flocculosa]
MPPRRSSRSGAPQSRPNAKRSTGRPPDDEETFDVHSVDDSSDDHPPPRPRAAPAKAAHARPSKAAPAARSGTRRPPPPSNAEVVDLSISDTASQAGSSASAAPKHPVEDQDDDDDDEMTMIEFEDVDVPAQHQQDHDSDEEAGLEMEDVDIDVGPQQPVTPSAEDELRDMYAAAYQEALNRDEGDGSGYPDDDDPDAGGDEGARLPIFKDGKGQHRGIEISIGTRGKKQDDKSEAAKKRAETMPTARDRQSRINAHKLYVLSILAFARIRNKWCNDDSLRDHLAQAVPDYMITKFKAIHPKKVPEQRERVRMFESFITELAKWWAGRFRLDPRMTAKAALRQPNQDIATGVLPPPGSRIDGWIVESAADREKRHRKERQDRLKKEADGQASIASSSRKGKGKAVNGSVQPSAAGKSAHKHMEITLFMPGTVVRPVFLYLLPPAEAIGSPADLLSRAEARSGSRETSAQLFCALCRSLGIPARLVVSVQPMPWSVGASKLANTAAPEPKANKGKAKAKSRLPTKTARFTTKPDDELTSDDEDFDGNDAQSSRSARSTRSTPRSKGSRVLTVESDSSLSDLSGVEEVESPKNRAARANQRAERDNENLARKAVMSAVKSPGSRRRAQYDEGIDSGATSDRSAASGTSAASSPSSRQAKGRAKVKAKNSSKGDGGGSDAGEDAEGADGGGDGDYRPAKWRNLDAPLKVEPKAKLRRNKPKALKPTELAPEDDSDVEPVDLQAPPTVWVEVFSKPFQKWITVDPVRSVVRAAGSRWMEPSPTDKQNKLVYVVAMEEDGYARDVTPRYTNKLNSRVARLRPPTRSKNEDDWWAKTARAIHRPQRLDRDAMEDIELNESASREAMPTSVAGYKDHPVYFLEKHLKRDEVVYPRNRIATFQGMDVFRRSNVLTLRSSRQWFNEGRVVKDNEVALKWVKSRGYTLANKRAEEQAKAEGREAPNEGLYAEFQTELYVPPPIVDGKIPTNSFGNIDLFVPSMLPKGAAHIPFSGVAKIAKKLGISYAEAITGFEFRKHRGMPKITGIVVPIEHEQTVLDAYWEHEHLAAERESTKRQERAIKAWKKLLNGLRIAKRVREQYGNGSKAVKGSAAGTSTAHGHGDAELSTWRRDDGSVGGDGAGGGFLLDDEEEEEQAERPRLLAPSAPSSVERRGGGMEEMEVDAEEIATTSSPPPLATAIAMQAEADEIDDEEQEAPRPRRTGPIVSHDSLIQAESRAPSATSAPPPPPTTTAKKRGRPTAAAAAAKPRGRPRKASAQRGTKRSRRQAADDDDDDDGEEEEEEDARGPPAKQRASTTATTRTGTRRSSRRSAVAATSKRGVYTEPASDDDDDDDEE